MTGSQVTLDGEVLRRRAEIARYGVVSVALMLDKHVHLVGSPSIVARGVPGVDDDEAALRAVARAVVHALERVRSWRGVDLADELRRAARRALLDLCGFRPVVEVHVLRDA